MRFKLALDVSLFLFCGRDVLLLRRRNTGYEDGNYHVPAGHVEEGEDAMAAVIREASEEIGIEIARRDLSFAGVMHRRAVEERISLFFSATRWCGEVENREPHKCDQLNWFPITNLPDNVVGFVREALLNFLAGEYFAIYGWSSGEHRKPGGV